MIAVQLLLNGVVTGCALGIIAISFSLIYSTTGIFHVAHAGVYTLGGYVAWSLIGHGVPSAVAFVVAITICAIAGSLIQLWLYAPLAQRKATPLVVLIASLGLLAVMQNVIAAIYTPNILQFPLSWSKSMVGGDALRLSYPQVLTLAVGFATLALAIFVTKYTILGKRIRAVANNPFLAEITQLRPQRVHMQVMAIASGMVCLAGLLVPLDFGLQPYNGVTPLLTATVAMIAGGIGSIAGAFAVAMAIAILQNLALLVAPGEWGVGITFSIFVVFMLFRPTGLFGTK